MTLVHGKTLEVAVAELKVIEVPASAHYPDGFKFSMFLVLKESGQVLVGFDNHKPKGPHLHLHGSEALYDFKSVGELVEDFWRFVRKEGFIV
ncbi:MAG: hypothetical protein HY422_02080 [Candidatus Komeilibacteria bacterium]|nr:hypothetical protein [Candidatus Komeilibacteria bacterium]